MHDRPVFLDSNIILYAFSSSDTGKSDIARRLLANNNILISTQVINEFVAVARKKFRQPFFKIESAVKEILQYVHVVPLTTEISL